MAKPILTPTPDITTTVDEEPTQPGTDAEDETLASPLAWISRDLAKSDLTPVDRLIELAVTDRADNKTGLLVWDNAAIAKRCGPAGKPLSRKTVSAARPKLVKAGFISIEREARGSKPALVRVHKVSSKQRLEVPLALFWAGAGEPLKATSTDQAADALTGLLALLSIADFKTHKVDANLFALGSAFVGRVEMKNGGTRLGRESMSRAISELEILAGPAVTVDKKQIEHGRYVKHSYAYDWSLLPEYERMHADSPEVHSEFPGGEFMTRAAIKQASIVPVAILELVAAFHEKVMDLRREHLSPDAPIVQINPRWFADMSTVVADGALVADVDEVIKFAFQHEFWRSLMPSPAALANHYSRLRGDADFAKWREAEGLVQWSPEVNALCDTMSEVMDFTYPGESHTQVPLWSRGAADLLKKYSIVEIEDMMEWSLDSPRHISNVGSLLIFGWVSECIRRDNGFILWSKAKGREWAQHVRAVAQPPSRAAIGAKPGRARRIGPKVASNEVFKRYAAAQDALTAEEVERSRAKYRAEHPKRNDQPTPEPEKPLFAFPESNRL